MRDLAVFATSQILTPPIMATSEHFHPVEPPEVEEDLLGYAEVSDDILNLRTVGNE